MSSSQGQSDGPGREDHAERKERPRAGWLRLAPKEKGLLARLNAITAVVSVAVSFVALGHSAIAILARAVGISVIVPVAIIAIYRSVVHRVELPIALVLASGIVAALIGTATGVVIRSATSVAPATSAKAFRASPSVSVTSVSSRQVFPSPSPPPVLVFSDRFCTVAGGWTVGNGRTGGQYGSCAFHIYANANDIESSEPRARAVYPMAPSGIQITVTARRLLGAAEGDEFGVACRADGEGYAFIVQSDLAEIIKYSSITGQIGQPLISVPAVVDMNAHNNIQVTCATASDGAVHLALSVNGKKLATATDGDNPIPSGTVGIFAATTSATETPTEVEFEDFAVTRQ